MIILYITHFLLLILINKNLFIYVSYSLFILMKNIYYKNIFIYSYKIIKKIDWFKIICKKCMKNKINKTLRFKFLYFNIIYDKFILTDMIIFYITHFSSVNINNYIFLTLIDINK